MYSIKTRELSTECSASLKDLSGHMLFANTARLTYSREDAHTRTNTQTNKGKEKKHCETLFPI